jgi:putative copper export protein
MLALATANRFKLIPRLHRRDPIRARALASLKRNVLVEQVAGLIVLMIVGALGTWPPPYSG